MQYTNLAFKSIQKLQLNAMALIVMAHLILSCNISVQQAALTSKRFLNAIQHANYPL